MNDDAVDTLKTINRGLFTLVWVLVLTLGASVYGWIEARKAIEIYIPPDLSQGAVLHDGEIPVTTIYANADYLFRHLYFWPEDGEQDYRNRIKHLAAMLTPRCRIELDNDYQTRRHNIHGVNELAGRKRYVYPAPGAAFDASRVEILSDDVWVVNLDMQVIEYQHDRKVKDALVRYPLRVVKMNANREMNPWNIALDCYAGEPQRLEANLTTTEEGNS